MFRSHSATDDATEAWENMVSVLAGARESTMDAAGEARKRLNRAADALAGRQSRNWGTAAITGAAALAAGIAIGVTAVIAARSMIMNRREQRALEAAEDEVLSPMMRDELMRSTPTS